MSPKCLSSYLLYVNPSMYAYFTYTGDQFVQDANTVQKCACEPAVAAAGCCLDPWAVVWPAAQRLKHAACKHNNHTTIFKMHGGWLLLQAPS